MGAQPPDLQKLNHYVDQLDAMGPPTPVDLQFFLIESGKLKETKVGRCELAACAACWRAAQTPDATCHGCQPTPARLPSHPTR